MDCLDRSAVLLLLVHDPHAARSLYFGTPIILYLAGTLGIQDVVHRSGYIHFQC